MAARDSGPAHRIGLGTRDAALRLYQGRDPTREDPLPRDTPGPGAYDVGAADDRARAAGGCTIGNASPSSQTPGGIGFAATASAGGPGPGAYSVGRSDGAVYASAPDVSIGVSKREDFSKLHHGVKGLLQAQAPGTLSPGFKYSPVGCTFLSPLYKGPSAHLGTPPQLAAAESHAQAQLRLHVLSLRTPREAHVPADPYAWLDPEREERRAQERKLAENPRPHDLGRCVAPAPKSCSFAVESKKKTQPTSRVPGPKYTIPSPIGQGHIKHGPGFAKAGLRKENPGEASKQEEFTEGALTEDFFRQLDPNNVLLEHQDAF